MTPAPSPRVVGLVIPEPPQLRGLRLRGESLAGHALSRLAGAGVPAQLVGPGPDGATPLLDLCTGADLVVVHDALCPLLSADALATCIAAGGPGVAVVGTRPVTDTVKRVDDGVLGATVDRSRLVALAAPVVLGADVAAKLVPLLPTASDVVALPVLVGALAGLCTLTSVEVPSTGRRVNDMEDLLLLECLDDLAG